MNIIAIQEFAVIFMGVITEEIYVPQLTFNIDGLLALFLL